ncbi:zinc finger CCCH domain-containing protein 48-like isoform X1 [Sesamum indicum]|uniref:Zinc finger CCCH domain-containing protein 48-like isoform X1 n=1 Tax=Sesamum indicum TaxID=4182 RepID=A0A6I9U061_SESIN|nr:zinc finger CCCH domain-containing protein 48-like isoform X1 [Sesamum indicum]
MAVKAATRVSTCDGFGGLPVKTQVCTYWLAGRCNRNPCRFMHRESPPPQSREIQLAPAKDVRGMQSRKMTWRSPKYKNPETATLSSYKGGMHTSRSGQSSHQNVLANTGNENVHMDIEMTIASSSTHGDIQAQPEVLKAVRSEPENFSSQKAKPKQCKYWVTGNCVHGDKCKDLHSWFSGSGFTLLKKLEGHTKAVTGISLPSGSNRLYSCSKDKTIRAWDCHTGQCAGSVITDGEAGCLISEGSWLLVGLQTALKAWNLQHHAEFGFGLLAGLVCSMVLDDDKLFAGMEDGSILVWKLNLEALTLEAAEMLKGHQGAVTSLIVGSDNRLYSGSRDCTIRVWDRKNLHCLHTLNRHTRAVTAIICWDNYLLSASLDNTLKIWAATESGTIDVIHEIKEDCGFIALCGIHDAEAKPILLCSCNDNTVRLYDLPSFTERGRIFSKLEVEVIEIGSDGLFFTGDGTGEISVWKLHGVPCEETAL